MGRKFNPWIKIKWTFFFFTNFSKFMMILIKKKLFEIYQLNEDGWFGPSISSPQLTKKRK